MNVIVEVDEGIKDKAETLFEDIYNNDICEFLRDMTDNLFDNCPNANNISGVLVGDYLLPKQSKEQVFIKDHIFELGFGNEPKYNIYLCGFCERSDTCLTIEVELTNKESDIKNYAGVVKFLIKNFCRGDVGVKSKNLITHRCVVESILDSYV